MGLKDVTARNRLASSIQLKHQIPFPEKFDWNPKL